MEMGILGITWDKPSLTPFGEIPVSLFTSGRQCLRIRPSARAALTSPFRLPEADIILSVSIPGRPHIPLEGQWKQEGIRAAACANGSSGGAYGERQIGKQERCYACFKHLCM